jgi:thymidylate synthase ThyX
MRVKLLSYTPDAVNLLLRTKGTRLRHESDPASWSDAQRAEHLAYMRDTIRSSWEFVDYVFQIEGVTRAFTQQLERTRAGSYAEESLRTVDASNNGFVNPLPPNAGGLPAAVRAIRPA